MATAVSTVFERRTALAVVAGLVCVTAIAACVASVQLPPLTSFLPIYTTLACAADALTAFLLFGQARANRRPPLLVLAVAYAYCACAIVAHVLVFPGVLTPDGLFGATKQSAVWFWVWWHGGFPLLLLAYVSTDVRYARRPRPAAPHALVSVLAFVATASVVASLLVFTLRADRLLPQLIVAQNYHALLTTGVGPLVLSALLAALGAVIVATRLRTTTSVWLAVALVAMLCDVSLTLAGGGRFTFGWYLARVESLIASFAVLLSFLGSISRMYEQLAQMATVDGLTGIANRRAFDESLRDALAASVRAKVPLALLMLDVDHFKTFNDRYGHVAGDECLRAVAEAARGALTRRTDLLARYGGEEFAMVLLGTDGSGARRVAERVRAAIAARAVARDDVPSRTVTASIGVYGFDPVRDPALAPDELIRRADEALYCAKHKGRDRVVAFGE